MSHVVVIGGGISGMTAAVELRHQLGASARITVIEASGQLGGKLRTAELAGRPFDVGAEAFLVRRPEAVDLIRRCGLESSLVHPTAVKATIRAGGRTVEMPGGTLMGIPASAESVRSVLSEAGADLVGRETQLPAIEMPSGDLDLGRLLRARFGDELVDRLVDPLLGGVYAGGADGLGLKATMPGLARALASGYGSLTEAVSALLTPTTSKAPVFGTLVGGLSVLVARLAELAQADIRFGVPVRALRRAAESRITETREDRSGFEVSPWELELGAAASSHAPAEPQIHADAVLLAVPAPAARRLLDPVVPLAARALSEIELASMAVISLALPPETVLPQASGVLVGAGERADSGRKLAVKAMTFSSRKWSHHGKVRTEEERSPILIRGSIGRFGEAETLQCDDEELVRRMRADLAELTGIAAAPLDTLVTRWGGGLPQYAVGHVERISRAQNAIRETPGLAIAGAMLNGVGIPACIASAQAAAKEIADQLTRSSAEKS